MENITYINLEGRGRPVQKSMPIQDFRKMMQSKFNEGYWLFLDGTSYMPDEAPQITDEMLKSASMIQIINGLTGG